MRILDNPFEKDSAAGENEIAKTATDPSQNPENPSIPNFTILSPRIPETEHFPFFIRENPFETAETVNSNLTSLKLRVLPINSQVTDQSVSSLADSAFFGGKKDRKQYVSEKQSAVAVPRIYNKKMTAALQFKISDLKKSNCCNSHCTLKFDQSGVMQLRKSFWGTPEHPSKSEEQKTFISKMLVKWGTWRSETDMQFGYFYKDSPICSRAFEVLLPISKNRMINVRDDIRSKGEYFFRGC